MKRLIVVRHAKSSWSNPHLGDSERPLNKRGHRNAPEMGKRLKSKGFIPDLIVSSKANRALTTAKYIAAEVGYDEADIYISDYLYHRDEDEMIELIRNIDQKNNTVMIFGHNPGFTDLVNYLTGSDIYNIPTAGLAVIEFDSDHWSEIKPGAGNLRHYDYPKNRN